MIGAVHVGARSASDQRNPLPVGPRLTSSRPASRPIAGEPVVPGTNRSPDVVITRHRRIRVRKAEFPRPPIVSRRAADPGRGHRDAALEHASRSSSASTSTGRTTRSTTCSRRAASTTTTRGPISSATTSSTPSCAGVGRFYSTFSQGIGPTAFKFATVDYAAFVQDTWHIQPRVTINWGLRYDLESMPSPQIPNPLEPRTERVPERQEQLGTTPRHQLGRDRDRATRFCAAATACSTAASSTRRFRTPSPTPGMATGQLQLSIRDDQAGAPAYPNILADRISDADQARYRLLPGRCSEPADPPVRSDLRSAHRRQHGALGFVRRKPGAKPAALRRLRT